jgi:hypothetical protein
MDVKTVYFESYYLILLGIPLKKFARTLFIPLLKSINQPEVYKLCYMPVSQ